MQRSIFRAVYGQILQGLPGVEPPTELAARMRARSESESEAVERTVALHTALGSSQGFLFGLPGLLFLPVTLPGNILAAAAIQLHMAATLASLAGEDPAEPGIRDRCVKCLLRRGPGHASSDEEEEFVVRTTAKLAERGIRWLVGSIARRTARAGFRRVGVRSVPLIGGLIGATSDGWVTRSVAECARTEFLSGENDTPPNPP